MSSSFRKQSRQAALCGLMAALSVTVLLLCGLIPLATFACPLLAMICLIPVLRECGSRLALVCYAAVSLLAVLLVPDKELVFFYLFLGYYPVLRPVFGRISSPLLRGITKCLFFSVSITVMYLLLLFLFQLEAVAAEFAGYSPLMVAALLVLGNATMLLFDRALVTLGFLYERLIRKRFF